jgi:hypothetical protein
MKFNKDMKYDRLFLKNMDQQFLKRIEEGMGCAPFVSEAILEVVHNVYFSLFNSPDNLTPGKINYTCVSRNEAVPTPISKAELVTVILTLDAGESDLKIRQKEGVQGLRQERIIRMCSEAYNQGGLLTVEDLAYRILNAGERTIVRDLKEIRIKGDNPPLRSTIKDMGRTITHKKLIIKNWLKGDELSDLKRKYNHSFSAIENYINKFKRVVFLSHENKPIEQIAYLLKISVILAESYLEIWKNHSEKALPHRKNEILELIGTNTGKKKKGAV